MLTFPPTIKVTKVKASDHQKQEIISLSFPKPVVLPHPGYLSTRFSNWHPGVDIASGLGMHVHAITSGIVEEVKYGLWGYGNHIIISHAFGFKSLYGHLGKMFVKIGQKVSSENILAEVGMSGATSGPHTHLEIQKDGNYIDPLTILPEIPNMPKPEYLTKQFPPQPQLE